MEAPKTESPKLPDMVMCGDHPSFTKTELNVKESKIEEKEKTHASYARISPSSSRTDRVPLSAAVAGGGGEARRPSEHTMRLVEARRRVRAIDPPRSDIEVPTGNRALLQAALGSFRWPPYLLGVWVCVLVLTHILHCLVTMLERALPNLRRFCQYFRSWTEEAWKVETELNHRIYPLALGLVTGLLYTVYFALYVIYSVAVWSIEPLCAELDEKQSSSDIEAKVTNYVDDVNSKTNMKH